MKIWTYVLQLYVAAFQPHTWRGLWLWSLLKLFNCFFLPPNRKNTRQIFSFVYYCWVLFNSISYEEQIMPCTNVRTWVSVSMSHCFVFCLDLCYLVCIDVSRGGIFDSFDIIFLGKTENLDTMARLFSDVGMMPFLVCTHNKIGCFFSRCSPHFPKTEPDNSLENT